LISNISSEEFVSHSLELNLFFLRIMKEHAIFLEAGFVGKDKAFIDRADRFKNDFTALLYDAIELANGNIRKSVLRSEELVTKRTLDAERKTEALSGIPIDTALTTMEMGLTAGSGDAKLEDSVRSLNERAINLTKTFADFKAAVLADVLACQLFTWNFPLLIDHILREARFFIEHLEQLQTGTMMTPRQAIIEEKVFWDRIMAEHAMFISHYLDPSEMALIKKANQAAATMTGLENRAKDLMGSSNNGELRKLVKDEVEAVSALRQFKKTGEELILECKLKSLIPPLLADHVFRESSHFLRLLEEVDLPAAKKSSSAKSKVRARRR